MNKNILEGKWTQLKGKVQETWGKLTKDDIQKINGKSKVLAGVLQERYGYKKEEAENKIKKFLQENKDE